MTDAPQYRDRLPAADAGAAPVLARFTPSRAAYVRHHLGWAAGGGVGAVALLWVMGRGHTIWAGVLGVGLALIVRGFWLYRDAMRAGWLLTADDLLGPGERIPRSQIAEARPFLGDVIVTISGGRRVLIRYLDDPEAAAKAIRTLR